MAAPMEFRKNKTGTLFKISNYKDMTDWSAHNVWPMYRTISMDVDFYWRCLLWTPLKMRKRLWCVLTEWQASSDWAEQRAPTYIPFTALSAHAYNAVDVITWSRIGEKSTVRTLIDQLSISEHWLCNRSCLRKFFFDEAIMVYFSPARTWTELWSRPWVYERTGESRG